MNRVQQLRSETVAGKLVKTGSLSSSGDLSQHSETATSDHSEHSETAATADTVASKKRPCLEETPEGASAKWLKTTVSVEGENVAIKQSHLTREDISERAQELIEQLNQKRSRDSQILVQFKESLIAKVDRMCEETEKQLYAMYNRKNQDIQELVQKLYAVLERIEKTESELSVFKQHLSIFYRDITQ